MSTADDDMETNATLRICFRTRYRRNSASEFDERVRGEMMKISDDETLGSLRNLCAELVTFDTRACVESMRQRVDLMCSIALNVFEQNPALDDAKRNELRKEIQKIEEKSANAWEHKMEMSRSKTDRRNKHKVEENLMREELSKHQLAGQVRLLGMEDYLTTEHVDEFAQVANATQKKNLKYEIETVTLKKVLESFQTADPREPRAPDKVMEPILKQAWFNRSARDKDGLFSIAQFCESYLEGLRNQETTQMIDVVNRGNHKHLHPLENKNYPASIVDNPARFEELVKKYRYGKALVGKLQKISPFQAMDEGTEMKTKREEIDELFEIVHHTYVNPSDGNTQMVIDGGHRLLALYLVALNILPILRTKAGAMLFYDDLIKAPHASKLYQLSKTMLHDTKITFRIHDESLTDELAARICYSNMLCHQTTAAQKLFARNPCIAFGDCILRIVQAPEQLEMLGITSLMQAWKLDLCLPEETFVAVVYAIAMVMLTEPLLDVVSGPGTVQHGISKGKPAEMEKFLQNIGWIDVDGPYGRMVRKDMEDEFLHEFYGESMTRELFMQTACTRLGWCKTTVGVLEELKCGTPVANWSSACFIIDFLRNPDYQGDNPWHFDGIPTQEQVRCFVKKLNNHRTLEWFSNGKTRITKEFVRFFQALWHTIHTQDDVDIHEYVRDLSKQKRMAIKAIEDGHGDVADVPALPMYLQRGGGGGGASGGGKKRRRKDAGVDADGDKAKRAKKPAARRNKGGKSLPKQRRQARPAAAASSSDDNDSDADDTGAALKSASSSDAGSGDDSA